MVPIDLPSTSISSNLPPSVVGSSSSSSNINEIIRREVMASSQLPNAKPLNPKPGLPKQLLFNNKSHPLLSLHDNDHNISIQMKRYADTNAIMTMKKRRRTVTTENEDSRDLEGTIDVKNRRVTLVETRSSSSSSSSSPPPEDQNDFQTRKDAALMLLKIHDDDNDEKSTNLAIKSVNSHGIDCCTKRNMTSGATLVQSRMNNVKTYHDQERIHMHDGKGPYFVVPSIVSYQNSIRTKELPGNSHGRQGIKRSLNPDGKITPIRIDKLAHVDYSTKTKQLVTIQK